MDNTCLQYRRRDQWHLKSTHNINNLTCCTRSDNNFTTRNWMCTISRMELTQTFMYTEQLNIVVTKYFTGQFHSFSDKKSDRHPIIQNNNGTAFSITNIHDKDM